MSSFFSFFTSDASSEQMASESPNISLTINGQNWTVDGTKFLPTTSLNDFIRDEALLTGTKYMCQEGGCGACTVSVTTKHDATPITVNSCLVMLYMCDGWYVTTIEGLGSKKKGYHPIQQKLADKNGSQCGYCSPGMVMTLYGSLQNNPKLTKDEVEGKFDGNLCRCTGYRPIMNAMRDCIDIEDVAKCATCPNKGKTDAPPTALTVQSGGTTWVTPTSLAELKTMIVKYKDQSPFLVAGHTSVGIYKKEAYAQVYIDLSAVPDLRANSVTAQNTVKFGASTTLAALEPLCKINSTKSGLNYLTALASHLEQVASTHVRNVAGVAGNLMIKHNHPDFPSDIYVLLEAVGAQLEIVDAVAGTTSTMIPSAFLKLDMKGKFILSVELPSRPGYQLISYKIMPTYRNAKAYINMAMMIRLDSSGNIADKSPSLVFGGISKDVDHAIGVEDNLKVGADPFTKLSIFLCVSQIENLPFDDNSYLPSIKFRKSLCQSLYYKALLFLAGDKLKSNLSTGGQPLIRAKISSGTQSYETDQSQYPLTLPTPKVDSVKQTSGESQYVTDIPRMKGQLLAVLVKSKVARADLVSIDVTEAEAVPGVFKIITSKDITGTNLFLGQQVLLVEKEVSYYGQALAIILADDLDSARTAKQKVKVTYTNEQTPILTFDEAIAQKSFHPWPATDPNMIQVGNADDAMAGCDKTVKGSLYTGEQYHFYMETQACVALPQEGYLTLYAGSQVLDMVKRSVAKVVGIDSNKVEVITRRVGGGFGGKQQNSLNVCSAAALAAHITNRPVSLFTSLEDNMQVLGRRQPYRLDYEAGVKDGKIVAVRGSLYENCGYQTDSATCPLIGKWIDSVYFCPNWNINLHMVKTNQANHAYVRAPGSLSAAYFIEMVMDNLAPQINQAPEDFKYNNMYKNGDKTPSGETINSETDMYKMMKDVRSKLDFDNKKLQVQAFNKANKWRKQGFALSPVRYWQCYFPNSQFTILVFINKDGGNVTVQHGGIELGQGINTKVIQVAARTLGIDMSMVDISPTSATVNHHSSETGGSVTSDMNNIAVLKACTALNSRLKPIKDELIKQGKDHSWPKLIEAANEQGVDLSEKHYFNTLQDGDGGFTTWMDCWGVIYTLVELDVLTGNYIIKTADFTYDCGSSYSPEIDVGQIEGAFVMSLGSFLTEEMTYDSTTGEMLSKNTWEYKIPGARDIPVEFNVSFLRKQPFNSKLMPLRNKVVGEPPMLAGMAGLLALKAAINETRAERKLAPIQDIAAPLTVEKILGMCELRANDFTVDLEN